jgi:hypothetical protein
LKNFYFSWVNPGRDKVRLGKQRASVHDLGTCCVDAGKGLPQPVRRPTVHGLSEKDSSLFHASNVKLVQIVWWMSLPEVRSLRAVERRQKRPVRPAPPRQWTTIGWVLLRCCCQQWSTSFVNWRNWAGEAGKLLPGQAVNCKCMTTRCLASP